MKVSIRIRMKSDGSYTAYCPALPGCVVVADNRELVERQIRDAAMGYIASMNGVASARFVISEAGVSAV